MHANKTTQMFLRNVLIVAGISFAAFVVLASTIISNAIFCSNLSTFHNVYLVLSSTVTAGTLAFALWSVLYDKYHSIVIGVCVFAITMIMAMNVFALNISVTQCKVSLVFEMIQHLFYLIAIGIYIIKKLA